MSDFTAIGQYVTEAKNLLDAIKGGAIRTMQNSFDSAMRSFTNTFNSRLAGYQGQMNLVTKTVMEVINGVNVYHVAGKKCYRIKHNVFDGGYEKGANVDPSYPNAKNPQTPTYFNLLEFIVNSSQPLGSNDAFKVEFYMTHRGMTPYLEHFVFTGISSGDSVSGVLEVKHALDNNLSLFISQPSGDREIPLTSDMEGKRIPISLCDIGQSLNGAARLTLKVDTRSYASAPRRFNLDVEYTSSRAQPPVNLVNQSPVSWRI